MVLAMFETDGRDRLLAVAIGVGLVFGVAAGTVLLAVTSNPVWLGMGPGLGITFGAAFGVVALDGDAGSEAAGDGLDPNHS